MEYSICNRSFGLYRSINEHEQKTDSIAIVEYITDCD